jgi:Tfp pilus assembly protein PilE
MFNQSWSKAMKRLGQLGGSGQMEIETGMAMNLLDTMASKFSQAFLAKQWRLCMEAYTFMIADLEQAVAASKETPWKDIQSNWADQNILNYGILAKMLIPALSNIQEKAIHIQVKLELAKVAIDLERFYLKHGSYPDSLDDLSPAYRPTPTLDPMTQKALSYRRNEGGGFEIFSVGMNGTDDGGKHIKKPKRNQTNPPDDLLWRIEKSSPLLPAFQVDA